MYRLVRQSQVSIESMRPTRAEVSDDAWSDRPGGAADKYLRHRQSGENFPVALRLLPRGLRVHLRNVYDVTRVIDDLGDAASGDRSAQLVAFRTDLDTIWQGGQPRAPVLRRLAGSVHSCGLSRQPFADLIEANLLDQTTAVYPTYDDLLAYCELSANPVGRMVLEVFGARTPERVALSDRVCTALQIIEHCQDAGEDYRSGRIYLPLSDLDRFGVARADLGAATTSPTLRRLIAFEAERAESMLASGAPLVAMLNGWARLAVAGYVAGGQAAVAALRRAGWSVLPSHPRARRSDLGRALAAICIRALPQGRGEVP
jgi:squalene synthase HpnC